MTTRTDDLTITVRCIASLVLVLSNELQGYDADEIEWLDLLASIRTQRLLLADIEAVVEGKAAAAMTGDIMEWPGGIAERRGGKNRKEWDKDRLLKAVTARLRTTLAETVDPATGEVIQDEAVAEDVTRTVAAFTACFRPEPRIRGLRELGIRVDAYCEESPARFTVTIRPAGTP